MNESDRNCIFFSADFVDSYGGFIIAYAPEDILVDSNVYFLPDGKQSMHERVISDTVSLSDDDITPNEESDLQLPFDNAYIAVRKRDFFNTCVELLRAGYSKQWIQEHVFSYRGEGRLFDTGQRQAGEEIRRRISKKRQTQSTQSFTVLPNPYAPNPETAKVYQLVNRENE